MAEPKFTRGPWAATHNGTCWQIDAATDAVATTQFCYASETEANARLIAAAPDLYEALTFILDHIADKERRPADLYPAFGLDARRAIEMAAAALAKAEGR